MHKGGPTGSNRGMNVTLLAQLQGIGVVTLAIVAFAAALTWPALIAPIRGMRSVRSRTLAFTGLGLALMAATVPLYLAPGVLLRGGFDVGMASLLSLTWLIAVASLLVRGMLLTGVVRATSFAFGAVAGTGLIAGILSALCAQHGVADTLTPTGAFLLAVSAVAGVVFWSCSDGEDRVVRQA
jgi:hypothetical protein